MLPDLLLGTRRLRRDIDAHSRQLEHDIAQLKGATSQLRRTTVASVTSPLGLLSATGLGFLVGRMAGRPRSLKPSDKNTLGEIAALALTTARSMGLQILLPMAVGWIQEKTGWLQSKLTDSEDRAANKETRQDDDAAI
ncbi:MAG: hypothetical protein QM709_14820 [Spongiibacteraceae bacterium]